MKVLTLLLSYFFALFSFGISEVTSNTIAETKITGADIEKAFNEFFQFPAVKDGQVNSTFFSNAHVTPANIEAYLSGLAASYRKPVLVGRLGEFWFVKIDFTSIDKFGSARIEATISIFEVDGQLRGGMNKTIHLTRSDPHLEPATPSDGVR